MENQAALASYTINNQYPSSEHPHKLTLVSSSRSLASQVSTQFGATSPKVFTCSKCNKAFPRRSRLEVHERTHVSFRLS